MSKGFIFDPDAKRISFVNGPRTVASTDGTLINLLPAADGYSATISVVFPDFLKNYMYNHWWLSDHNQQFDVYGMDEGCKTAITVRPQEWSDTTVLAAAPAGADFFAARVRLNRVNTPTTWNGGAVNVLPKVNQWLPFTGSVLVEAEVGMARAFSIYIVPNANEELPGQLILHRQQSVSTPAGGYGAYGASSPPAVGDATGGTVTHGGAAGIPVYTRQVFNRPSYVEEPVGPFPPGTPSGCVQGGPFGCAVSDVTNYSSTYSVEINGQFGRRS